ncbi:MAG: class I SAM-dependent methyltransferase, partial [Polyangiales bacterium]
MNDVPSPIDLQDEHDAQVWVAEADAKRPWRARIRDLIAGLVTGDVLELGAGPGLLAERVLREGRVATYTVFDFS